MKAFLYFTLEDSGAGRFVVIRNFEDMGGIDEIIVASSHHMVTLNIELIDGHLEQISLQAEKVVRNQHEALHCCM